jgi:hypothetical protein
MENLMFKKIMLGTLFIGLIALLIAGGVIRTMDKTASTAEVRGRNSEATEDNIQECDGHGGAGQGNEEARGAGNQGNSSSAAPKGEGANLTRAQADSWLELAGTVADATSEELLVQLEDNTTVSITGRPWRFAQENGFAAAAGDSLTLTGFYEGERLEIGAIEDSTSGQSVLIRQQDGRPMWAGGGRVGN